MFDQVEQLLVQMCQGTQTLLRNMYIQYRCLTHVTIKKIIPALIGQERFTCAHFSELDLDMNYTCKAKTKYWTTIDN